MRWFDIAEAELGQAEPGTVDLLIDRGRDTQMAIALPADEALRLGRSLVVAAGPRR